ncbi:MAG: DUF6455 family protein [Pseudomonadota bacterium]
MFSFSKYDRHAALMTRMSDTVGQDLDVQMQMGTLTPQDFRSMVFNCLGCREAGTCEKWLDDQNGRADAAPGFCRNKSVFNS